jgi:hypothetical protein
MSTPISKKKATGQNLPQPGSGNQQSSKGEAGSAGLNQPLASGITGMYSACRLDYQMRLVD